MKPKNNKKPDVKRKARAVPEKPVIFTISQNGHRMDIRYKRTANKPLTEEDLGMMLLNLLGVMAHRIKENK